VQVNGTLCLDEARRLAAGDTVTVWDQPLLKPADESDIRICRLDPHLVVVDKPAGMTSERYAGERHWPRWRKAKQPTLEELLPALIAQHEPGRRSHRKGSRRRPRVRSVHRIDRDTSGLLVFALSADAERHLVQQFRRHTVHRRYVAVVHGDMQAATIVSHLVRDRGDGRRGSTTLPNTGKRAVTHVEPIESLPGYTVVSCRLETGRTHQIRIHLAEQGHWVCGEKAYRGAAFTEPPPDFSGAPRHALHAAELGFVHPILGETLFFESPLPQDLVALIERLKSS
jgi:23S rRNA pseudouridine1911/1915/1917 synthase